MTQSRSGTSVAHAHHKSLRRRASARSRRERRSSHLSIEPLEQRLLLANGDGFPDVISVGRTLSAWSAADVQNRELKITYSVYNQQAEPVSGVLLATTLEPGVTFVSATVPTDRNGQELAWSFGTIEAFGSASVEVRVALAEPVPLAIDGGSCAFGTVNARAESDCASPARLRAEAIDPELLRSTVDANTSDPFVLAKAAELNQDAGEIFEFLTSEVGYESYVGSLRGARGTLWSSAGNALDEASLMVAMLRSSGIPARYAQGTLPDNLAQELILSMFPPSFQTVGFMPAGTEVADPANDPKLLAETRQHFWVQFDATDGDGAVFTDADPAFVGAQLGQTFAPLDPQTPTFTEVPDDLRHKVTVRLNRELTFPQSLFGGATQSVATVLDETFSTVELVGRSLTFGQFVNRSSLGFLFTATTTTFSPYIVIGDDADPRGEAELIRGEDFQEVLTNFPFGSQLLTGLFLEIELSGPDGPAEIFGRTLLDRIGFDVRQNGGTPTGTFDANGPPPLTPFDFWTVSVLPGRQDATVTPRIEAALQHDFATLRDQMAAQQTAATPLTIAEIPIGLTRSYLTSLHATSDLYTDALAGQSLVRAYFDRPRITIVSTRATEQDSQNATLEFEADLRRDSIRVVAAPGQATSVVPPFRTARGVIQNIVETNVFPQPGPTSGLTVRNRVSTSTVFQSAAEQGIPIATLTPEAPLELETLAISSEARARIAVALGAGKAVLVPAAMVSVGGEPHIGWFEIDRATGETVAVGENGSHQGITQYAAALAIVTIIEIVGISGAAAVLGTAYAIIDFNAIRPNYDAYLSAFQNKQLALQLFEVDVNDLERTVSPDFPFNIIDTAHNAALQAQLFAFRLSVGDPPVPAALANPAVTVFGPANVATGDVPFAAGASAGAVAGSVETEHATIAGRLNAAWTSATTNAFRIQSLGATGVSVFNDAGVPIGSGNVSVVGSDLPVSIDGPVSYVVTGDGSLSFYSDATTGTGVSGEWSSYTANLTCCATIRLATDSLVLNGAPLPAGSYRIVTDSTGDSVTLTGRGPSTSPNFLTSVSVGVANGSVEVGPGSGNLTVGGVAAASGTSSLALTGFSGTASVAADTGSDTISLAGTAAHVLSVAGTPAMLHASQNSPASFQIEVTTSLADTYEVTAAAPFGWSVAIDATGRVTVTPAPGLQSGVLPIRLTARSATRPELVASGEVMVTIDATAPAITLAVDPDSQYFVPFFGAQVPTAFRATIHNDGPGADTFAITFPTVPAGFQIQSSATMVTIPAGETAIVGVYLVPNGPLPAPGTAASFQVVATSTTSGAISAMETENFIVPEIHGVTIAADPPELSTTPGAAQQTAIVLQSVGNVPENVTFTADLSSGLALDGLAPQSLAVGELKVFFVTLTPAAGTPLNSTLNAKITASFGAPESVSVSIPVSVVVPGAQAISRAATESRRLGNVDLANRLDDLSIALTNLVQDCTSEVFQSQSLAALDAVIGLLGVDSILVNFVAPLTAARDQLAAAGTEQQCLDAVTNLGQTLDNFGDTVFAISEHNVEAFLLPNSQVAQPQVPAQFDLRIHNISASVVSTTYNITLGTLPPGVTGMLSQDSVTLFRDEFASVIVTITQNSPSELLAFEFTVTVAADGFPEVARTVRGTLTARNEFVSVVSVTATPPFTDAGGMVDVSARVLNVVNVERAARASFVVKDSNGMQVGPASAPIDVTLTVQASLVTVPLGSIDTTGFANGNYSVEVMLRDMNDQPLPGGTGTGNFLVGSPVTATIGVSPDLLPPGTSTVTNTLEIEALVPLLKPPTVIGQVPVAGATDAVRNGDFVYVPGSAGISVFNIAGANLENPQFVRVVGSPTNILEIRNNLLIAVRQGLPNSKLDTYSLTDPSNPQLLGTTGEIPYSSATDIVVTDTHVFVAIVNLVFNGFSLAVLDQPGGMYAVNITDPSMPFFDGDAVALRGTPGGRDGMDDGVLFNDFGTSNDGIGVHAPIDMSGGRRMMWDVVQVSPTILYLMGSSATGTDTQTGVGQVNVVDISDPRNMRLLRQLAIPGTVHAFGIAIDGNRALVTASEGGIANQTSGHPFTGNIILATLDLSDPADPQLIDTQELPDLARGPTFNASLGNDLYAFGSLGSTGTDPMLNLVDVSNPRNLAITSVAAPANPFAAPGGDDLILTTDRSSLIIYRVPSSEPFTLVGVQPVSGGSRGVATRNDVAYACGANGIQVIDYSDPAAPAIQGTIAGNHFGCHVQDNVLLALRPVGNSSILDVYALQDTPLAPPLIGSSPVINYNLLNDLKSTSTHAFITQLNVCFFLGSNDIYHHAGDLISIALNLNDAANPTSAAPTIDSVLFNTNGDNTFDPTDVSGCAENGGDNNVWGVAFANPQTAYLATTTVTGGNTQAGVGRVKVVDVTNPASPAVVRELDIPGTVQTIGIGISGNVAVVIGSTGGFMDNPNGIVIGNLTVTTLDVTDPLDPQIVSSRTLNRITSTFWSNFVTLGGGLFAYSNLAFANGQGAPAVLLIDASNPRSPLIGQTDVPLDFVQPNSLATDGTFLLTADSAGVSIYEINSLPALPITARVQIPNGTGVAVVPGSFNIAPTEIIAGADFDTLVFDLTLTSTGQSETITWNSTVTAMQPGESRAVTLDTTIAFGFQGTPGQVLLPPQQVVSEQVLALDPASRTVQPGEPAIYTVTIANPAQVGVTYDLSIAGVPPEWVDFPAQVTVPAGGMVELDLTLTSDPFAPEATFGFVVTASVGMVAGSVEGTMNLVGDPILPEADPDSHGVVVSVSPMQADAGQGTAAVFVARVTNTGSVTETFDLSAALPAGLAAIFETTSIDVPPGAGNFRDVSFTVTPPLGTPPAANPFMVTATATADATTTSTADASVSVLAAGVDILITPGVFSPGTDFQLFVTNTGQFTDTFDLTLGGPAALAATLSTTFVTLAPGAFQFIDASMAEIDFAVPGDLQLTATATSRSSPTVQDTATATVDIATAVGLDAEFDPGMVELPQPGATTFLLMVENTGNTEDVYTATITTTSGPVAASLIGLDGLPTQTIPTFRLPGLATGAILLNANLTAFGQGDVTVRITSQANAGVVASATATVMSELEVDPCDAAPVNRAFVDAGNVRAEVVNGRLTITGDKLLNSIRVVAGLDANSLCIIGADGTTVNGNLAPELITGVTGSVFVRMRGRHDTLVLDGSVRPLVFPRDLNIRMNSVGDTLRLDHVTVAGKTRIRTGRGRDLVELVDTVLTGKSIIFTGRGDDTLRVRDSQFLSDIVFDGYIGLDTLDAGVLDRPNANGNVFARRVDVEFESLLS